MIKKKALNKTVIYRIFFALLFFSVFLFLAFQTFSKRELSLIWKQEMKETINCHTTSLSGELIAIGSVDGKCTILNQKGTVVFEKKLSFPILALKFSYDGNILYVKGQSLLAINLSNQKIWEKFKKDYIVEDFWVFRDGRCSVLMHDKKDIKLNYMYLDQNGQTVKEFVLPEVYGNYSCTHSVNGKYFLLSIQEGDLYLFQADSTVVWNIHLDPSVKEVDKEYPMYPIYQALANNGSVCLGYRAEEYGKDVFVAQLIDVKSNILWKKNLTSPISGMMFSPEEKKILISSQNNISVLELSGNTLYSIDQFGYQPILTKLGPTNLLVGFVPLEASRELTKNDFIFKLVSLSRRKVIWQKRVLSEVAAFSMEKNGYVLVEVTRDRVMYYRYVLQ